MDPDSESLTWDSDSSQWGRDWITHSVCPWQGWVLIQGLKLHAKIKKANCKETNPVTPQFTIGKTETQRGWETPKCHTAFLPGQRSFWCKTPEALVLGGGRNFAPLKLDASTLPLALSNPTCNITSAENYCGLGWDRRQSSKGQQEEVMGSWGQGLLLGHA